MITLTATTHKLELTTGSSTNIDVFISYADHTATGATLGDQQTLITTATTTDILAAPASSTQRQVKTIIVNNTSATSNAVVVKKDISSTEYDLLTVTLGPNEAAHFTDGQGWKVMTNSGAVKTSLNQGNAPINSSITSVVLGSDQTNNNVTPNTIADVTGLSFAVNSGSTYWFRFVIWYTSAATSTGSLWTINGPTTTLLGYRSSYSLGAVGTSGTDVFTDFPGAAYNTPTASNATSSTQTAGQANIAIIEGFITPSNNGTVIARFASEITNSAIVAKAGSTVFYQQVI
jgi:hypothetical protein